MSEVIVRRPTSTSTKITPTKRTSTSSASTSSATQNTLSPTLELQNQQSEQQQQPPPPQQQPHVARVTRVDVLPTPHLLIPPSHPSPTPSTTSDDEYVVIKRRPSQTSTTTTTSATLTSHATHADYVSLYPVLGTTTGPPGGAVIPLQNLVRNADLYVPTAPLATSDVELHPESTVTYHTQHVPIHPVTGQRLSPTQIALAQEIQQRNTAYFKCVAEAKKEFEKKEEEIRTLKSQLAKSQSVTTSNPNSKSSRDSSSRRKLLSILHDQGMRNDENRVQAFVRHEVVEGDELFGLAIKYGTTPEAIRQYNRRVVFDYLDNVQGEWLHIPIDAHLLTIADTITPVPPQEDIAAKQQLTIVNRQFYLIRSFMDLANDYYYKYLHQYNMTHGINQHRDRTVMQPRESTPAIANPLMDDILYQVIPPRPLTAKEKQKEAAKRELDAKQAAKQQQKLLQIKATADDIVTEGEAKFYLDENDWNMTRAMASWCDDRNWEQQQHREMMSRTGVSIPATTPMESRDMFTRESVARRDRIAASRAATFHMSIADAHYHALEDDDQHMARDEALARQRLNLSTSSQRRSDR